MLLRRIVTILFCLCWLCVCLPAYASWSNTDLGGGWTGIISVSTFPGINGGATAPVTTTGANLLIVSISDRIDVSASCIPLDSNGNDWTGVTGYQDATPLAHVRFWYVNSQNPIVGAGHTVTCTGTATQPVITFMAIHISGGWVLDKQNGSGASASVASISSGQINPTSPSFILANLTEGSALSTYPVGFSAVDGIDYVPATHLGGWVSSQVTLAAVNPLWEFGATSFAATGVVSFVQSGIVPPGTLTASASSSGLMLRGTSGGGGAFTPASISGLIRWGDSSREAYANNDPVSTYTDWSGQGNSFTQTGSNRPTFKTNVQSGKPGILFDPTSDQYLECDALATVLSGFNIPFTWGWAGKHSALEAKNQTFWMLANYPMGSNQPTFDLFYRSPSNNWWSGHRQTDGAAIKTMQGFTPDTLVHTFIVTFDGITMTFYVDGTSVGSQSMDVSSLTANAFFYGVHQRSDASDANTYFNGYWFEDVIYNSSLSISNVGILNTYLQSKWGSVVTPPPWEPYQLGNAVQFWARNDSWDYQSDGASVTTWYGKVSPNADGGNDLTGTGTYKANIINSKATVLLSGSSDVWERDALASVLTGTNTSFTFWSVFKPTDIANAQNVFSAGNNSDGNPYVRLWLPATSGTYNVARDSDAGSAATQSWGAINTGAHSVVISFDGTGPTVTVYMDGLLVVNAQSLSTGAMTLNTFGLGALIRTSVAQYFTGHLGEAGLLNYAISGVNLTNLLTYITGWWGL